MPIYPPAHLLAIQKTPQRRQSWTLLVEAGAVDDVAYQLCQHSDEHEQKRQLGRAAFGSTARNGR